jgi:hypothetical protein
MKLLLCVVLIGGSYVEAMIKLALALLILVSGWKIICADPIVKNSEPPVEFELPPIEIGPADSTAPCEELPDVPRLFYPRYYI